MDEIVSMVIANGIWAVLFCMLLVYELRDSRKREGCYTGTIEVLTNRLGALGAVKADVEEIKDCVSDIKIDASYIRSSCRKCGSAAKRGNGGAVCAEQSA